MACFVTLLNMQQNIPGTKLVSVIHQNDKDNLSVIIHMYEYSARGVNCPLRRIMQMAFFSSLKNANDIFPQEIKYHWLLYCKASLRQIRALWLVLSWSAIDDFVNQQESANTKKKTATDMNTLLRYMKLMVWKTSLSPFSIFFLTHAGKTEKAARQQQFPVFNPVNSDT